MIKSYNEKEEIVIVTLSLNLFLKNPELTILYHVNNIDAQLKYNHKHHMINQRDKSTKIKTLPFTHDYLKETKVG